MKRKVLAALVCMSLLTMQLTSCGNDIQTTSSVSISETSSSTDSSSSASVPDETSSTSSESAVEASVTEYSVSAEIFEEYTAQKLCSLAVNSDDYKIVYEDGAESKKFETIGTENVKVIAEDKSGVKSNWVMKVVVADNTPPVFEGVKDITVKQGETPDLKAGVSVKDNYDKQVEFSVKFDDEDKDNGAVGEHNLTYTATDAAGNVAVANAKLTVEAKKETTTTAVTTTKSSQGTQTQKTTQNTANTTTKATTKATTKPVATQPAPTTTKAPAASSSNVNFYKNKLVVAGDSIAYGFCAYGYIPYSHNIAKGSMAMRNYKDTSLFTFDPTGVRLSCMNAISAVKPQLLYVSMGMNDINIINQQTYAKYYVDFLKQVRARVPNCIIVACNITPTEARRSDFSSLRIRSFNSTMQSAVKAMNDPNIILFDAYSVVSAGGTYMASGYSAGDGIHLQGHVYQKLLNRLAVVLDQYGVKERIK